MLLRGEKGFYLVNDNADKAKITEYYRKDKDAFKEVLNVINSDR